MYLLYHQKFKRWQFNIQSIMLHAMKNVHDITDFNITWTEKYYNRIITAFFCSTKTTRIISGLMSHVEEVFMHILSTECNTLSPS